MKEPKNVAIFDDLDGLLVDLRSELAHNKKMERIAIGYCSPSAGGNRKERRKQAALARAEAKQEAEKL